MKTVSHPHFNRIIVLRNPASTHAEKTLKRIAKLRALAPVTEFEVVETSAGGHKANKTIVSSLGDKLGPKTLLCVAAGDGTINMIVETLLLDTTLSEAARQTPILPLWGGNANDLAHMLNGHGWKASLRHILSHGVILPVRPLQCSLTMQDATTQTHLAVCYASFGASAFATRRLSQPEQRNHRIDHIPGGRVIKELGIVIRSLMDAPQITIKEGKQTKKIFEHVFIKGSRFAKVKGVHLRLTDPHFYHAVVHHKRARSLFFHIIEITSPRAVKRVAGDHAEFTPQEHMWAQVDGEIFEIAAGTKVEINLSKQPIYLLSTLIH
jgi:diacylglycerol kinase family enzyme